MKDFISKQTELNEDIDKRAYNNIFSLETLSKYIYIYIYFLNDSICLV